MKVYAVVPVNFTYNDEVHCPEGFEKPTEAFRDRANAEARAAELNKKARKEREFEDYDGRAYEEYYVVQEVEVPDVVDLQPATPPSESPYSRAQRLKAEAAEAAKRAASDAFKEGAKLLFEKYPLLESFGFTAYTDYFNDGDTCRYHVHADEPYVNGERSYDNPLCDPGEKYDYKAGKTVKTGEPGPLDPAVEEISEFIYSFDTDDIESLFGDHVRVTVSYDRAAKVVTVSEDEYTSHD